ncbi:MAG: protein-L-isoaspartate(D-aspartate) O-methyltransferase [Syntrophorhabdaceae bacterium]|nr:protein-L-isoaspartate(D-aspartate) O-methyltransferase [Syntrophorhabdaceae bacterium]
MVMEETFRRAMVDEQIRRRGVRDKRLLAAMEEIPRHLFIPADFRHRAYADEPVSIGEGQTISQPFIVAEMTAALELTGQEKVLEIGTGSGYQTAILSKLSKHVVTVERVSLLASKARWLLDELGYENIDYHVDDGSQGCRPFAPYDRILAAAASPTVPRPLVEQLADGGILVLPMGGRLTQRLLKVTKHQGEAVTELLGACIFVPMIGKYGFSE